MFICEECHGKQGQYGCKLDFALHPKSQEPCEMCHNVAVCADCHSYNFSDKPLAQIREEVSGFLRKFADKADARRRTGLVEEAVIREDIERRYRAGIMETGLFEQGIPCKVWDVGSKTTFDSLAGSPANPCKQLIVKLGLKHGAKGMLFFIPEHQVDTEQREGGEDGA